MPERFQTVSVRGLVLVLFTAALSGCFSLPQKSGYTGPPPRPASIDEYYNRGNSYLSFELAPIKEREGYLVNQISIETEVGQTIVDFYQSKEPNDDLIFVFPVLGGRPILSRYFADWFAKQGFDTAIVHRDNEFKKPENLDKIEHLFRQGIIRDRIVMDFFETEYGKKDFGSFGMSRGAINAAMTAGVDGRMKYNILALGGSDLPDIFTTSRERRIKNYKDLVMQERGMDDEKFRAYLDNLVKTDPKYFAHYLDSRNTLMLLSVCDKTVPYANGLLLREQIGNPETIFLLAGHKTSVLFTQLAKLLLPFEGGCLFPFKYIETESLWFYRKSFNREGGYPFYLLPFHVLQSPFNLVIYGLDQLP